jgi:hypothetical protein
MRGTAEEWKQRNGMAKRHPVPLFESAPSRLLLGKEIRGLRKF